MKQVLAWALAALLVSPLNACGNKQSACSNEKTTPLAKTKVEEATKQLGGFTTALTAYRMKFNRFPTTAEGLSSLIRNESRVRFLESDPIPKDPWNRDFIYRSDNPQQCRVSSAGPDGTTGTADDIIGLTTDSSFPR